MLDDTGEECGVAFSEPRFQDGHTQNGYLTSGAYVPRVQPTAPDVAASRRPARLRLWARANLRLSKGDEISHRAAMAISGLLSKTTE